MTAGALAASVLVATVVSGLVQLVLPSLLLQAQVVDVPTTRSSHATPTPRGGGIGLLFGLAAGTATWLALGTGADGGLVATATGAAVLAGAVGLVEDLRGVSARARLVMQLAAGAVTGGVVVELLGLSLVWVPVAALAVAVYVNVTNFMDGVDTISGGHGVTCGLAYAVAGTLAGAGTAWLVPAGLLLAASSAASAPVNGLLRAPARLFLGDVGSYALGACIAVLAGAGVLSGLPVVTALAPTTLWLADTLHTLLLRAAAGERLTEAHRTHAYQRLVDTGWSHRRVGAAAAAATVLAAAVGTAALVHPVLTLPAGLALVVLAWSWVKLPAWRGRPSPWGAVARARMSGAGR